MNSNCKRMAIFDRYTVEVSSCDFVELQQEYWSEEVLQMGDAYGAGLAVVLNYEDIFSLPIRKELSVLELSEEEELSYDEAVQEYASCGCYHEDALLVLRRSEEEALVLIQSVDEDRLEEEVELKSLYLLIKKGV